MRRKALAKIERLLAPGGVLFVDPVEQPLALERGFVRASSRCPSRAARQAKECAVSEWRGWRSSRMLQPGRAQRRVPTGHPSQAEGPSCLRQTNHPPPAKPIWNRRAAWPTRDTWSRPPRSAKLTCAKARVSAQAYYLLGLVRDAGGEPGAIECYRKALYLEPNHYESLLQMALLLQKNGDAARARTFKSRAQRLKIET